MHDIYAHLSRKDEFACVFSSGLAFGVQIILDSLRCSIIQTLMKLSSKVLELID